MPLSERIRLDAGRPYSSTLTARIYVAIVLLVFTFAVVQKNSSNLHDINGINFGKQEQTSPKQVTNIVVAKNDTYGR